MMNLKSVLEAVLIVALLSASSLASLRPEKIHVANTKKNKAFITDGLIIGGDRGIQNVLIQDIRRSNNPDYERVVIDVSMQDTQGEVSAVKRPPYFQVSVTPSEKRLVVSIWGSPRILFEPRKVQNMFKASKLVQSVELYPKLEPDVWNFSLNLMNSAQAVEVFELTNPVRIILDIKKRNK